VVSAVDFGSGGWWLYSKSSNEIWHRARGKFIKEKSSIEGTVTAKVLSS
jgi:hypothetical protein